MGWWVGGLVDDWLVDGGLMADGWWVDGVVGGVEWWWGGRWGWSPDLGLGKC